MPGSDFISATSIDAIVGNRQQIEKLKDFANDINSGKKRDPLLIWGPTGTGKTLAAHLIAKWAGWNIIEANPGDGLGAEMLERKTSPSSTSRGLFGSRNLILLDEIDELSSKYDIGASTAITRLINNSKNPIIMTANNMWRQNITFLRGKVEPIKFAKLTNTDIVKVLNDFCRNNGIKISSSTIEAIAVRASGDARSAINDAIALDGAAEESIEAVGIRDRKSEVFQALDRIFLSNTFSAPLRALSNSDVETEMMIKWIDENIPNRYSDIYEIYSAYEALSKSTTFASRAAASQYYIYWRYMSVLASSGVALSKTGRPSTAKSYAFPKIISSLSSTKTDRSYEAVVAKKLQKKIHSSSRYIRSAIIPLLSYIARRSISNGANKDVITEFFTTKLGLDDKEAEYIINGRKGSQAP